MKPEMPADEAARLEELESYDVLDTPAEAQFDAITRLAALALETPIALISLVDRDRQWFMSRYGLEAQQTGRDISFCAHAIADHDTLVVTDAMADPRFMDNPLVREAPGIRFYAGVLLETPDGRALGTLCAIDRRPRELTDAQRETLELLAGQVMALLELRRIGRKLVDQTKRLEDQQRRLMERELQLASLLDSMVEGVVVQDRSGAILLANPSAEHILGLRSDQLTGRTSHDPEWRATRADGSPFPGDQHPAMISIEQGTPSRDVMMGLHHAATGERRWIEINSSPLAESPSSKPYAALATFRDVTEQRQIQERMAQHDRLVTTGILAAGVGHEINNPLTYLMANIGLAIEELQVFGGTPSSRLTEIIDLLEQARQGGERVKRIVRGLKSLARRSAEVGPIDPHNSIRNAIELAGHELRARARITLQLEPVPLILVDEGQLTQVVVNLVINAAQAFGADDPTSNQVTIRTRRDQDRVLVEVSDNGPGIRPEVLPRIWDPFFTTRSPGVGTGLGLSISHGIVLAMGGRIECETEVGKGTTFTISFPIAAIAATEVEVTAVAGGRAMVVDDERTILLSFTRALRHDLAVESYDDSREALAAIERGERFDVIFSDILMPHLTGMDLYREIKKLDAEQAERIVFMSGDLSRSDIERFLSEVRNERLEKPFSIQNIRGIARRFVASRRP